MDSGGKGGIPLVVRLKNLVNSLAQKSAGTFTFLVACDATVGTRLTRPAWLGATGGPAQRRPPRNVRPDPQLPGRRGGPGERGRPADRAVQLRRARHPAGQGVRQHRGVRGRLRSGGEFPSSLPTTAGPTRTAARQSVDRSANFRSHGTFRLTTPLTSTRAVARAREIRPPPEPKSPADGRTHNRFVPGDVHDSQPFVIHSAFPRAAFCMVADNHAPLPACNTERMYPPHRR